MIKTVALALIVILALTNFTLELAGVGHPIPIITHGGPR